MNKSMKPKTPARPELTEEQKKQQIMRAYLQKKASLAEGILFNLVQGEGRAMVYDLDSKSSETKHLEIIKMADEMATEFMKVVCNAEPIVEPEDSAEE